MVFLVASVEQIAFRNLKFDGVGTLRNWSYTWSSTIGYSFFVLTIQFQQLCNDTICFQLYCL